MNTNGNSRENETVSDHRDLRGLRVAIIGAGMSGILAGIRLKEAGINDFVIFEKADKVGGTWRDNRYPGVACDVPSHYYSYTFEPNPDWTRRFSPGPEICEYFERCAEKYGIIPHVRFHTTVEAMEWNGTGWDVTTNHGDSDTYDIMISAAGVLHHPAYPDIEGLDSFEGDMFHTARWNQDVSLKGKRIGIIGTGSTAAQIVPAVIDEVEHLTLFQRTAQWIHPQPDKAYTRVGKALFRTFPKTMGWLFKFYQVVLNHYFGEIVVGNRDAAGLNKRCEDNLATVRDPELRAKLTPDYKPGCKRLIFSSRFYPAIQKPNAAVETEAIERIEPGGIRTKDGKLHELDILVLSTGFKADSFLRPASVVGENGADLDTLWEDGPKAYRAVTVPKMPNFFMLIGPRSPVGNLSLISISEWQMDYVMRCIEKIRGEHVAIHPTIEATDRIGEQMKERLKDTIWMSGCNSWYFDKSGVPALYPWSPFKYFDEMQAPPAFEDYVVTNLESDKVEAAA